MNKWLALKPWVMLAAVAGFVIGCASPSAKISRLRLGDTPEVIVDKMGRPNTVRAAKVYSDETTLEVWEYLPGILALYPKSYWLFIENGRLVQWGEPGDFAGKSGSNIPVGEYSDKKRFN